MVSRYREAIDWIGILVEELESELVDTERKPSRIDRVSLEVCFTVVHTGLAYDEDGHTRFLPL